METIRNYLETMFQNLPNTPEVQKAKYELGQMMEDKYTEMKEEGKTENEAIGIVISEFGNLNDLAEDLGIDNFVNGNEFNQMKLLSLQEVKNYISDKMKSGLMIGLGVFLCITSPSGVIMAEGDVWGLIYLLASIVVGVMLFIFTGAMTGKWSYLYQEQFGIDFATAEYVHNEKENYRMTNAALHAVGVMFCILCFVPLVVMEDLDLEIARDGFGVVVLLAFIGIGVFLFITAGVKSRAYDTLLKLNDTRTMGGTFVPSQNGPVRYTNKTVAAIMSVYWPTVTCIYLIWSFLTYDWHITWIIWVIAGVVENFIKNMYRN